MTIACTRRQLLIGTLGTLTAACAPAGVGAPARQPEGHPHAFAELEARIGGRVGVFAVDTGTGRALVHRPDERFAMCSTFKWVLAAAILARADHGESSLEETIHYGASDLLEHAPITRARLAEGSMTVLDLAEAAVTVSDNTAANLLLAKVGGPAGVTRFVRAQGDSVTRLDRTEPTLNDSAPDDPRDTTSPRAMVGSMRSILCGEVLSRRGRERLLGWLVGCTTGKDRLRAGLPADWTVGDKTGTGPHGAVNDVAIAWPAGRSPLLIAAYLSDSAASLAALNEAHAEVGRVIAREL